MRAPMVNNRRSFFCRGHSPKKVPPLLLQPPTLNLPLNRPASPPDDPQVESLRPGSPRPGPFFCAVFAGDCADTPLGAGQRSRIPSSVDCAVTLWQSVQPAARPAQAAGV